MVWDGKEASDEKMSGGSLICFGGLQNQTVRRPSQSFTSDCGGTLLATLLPFNMGSLYDPKEVPTGLY